jgi:nucleolar protein 9
MPKENRKRGKKRKRTETTVADGHKDQPSEENLPQPSWIHSAEPTHGHNPEAPYGYVDNDVKAYFRTVDVQIRDWQEDKNVEEVSDGDKDPNEGIVNARAPDFC